MTNLVTAGSRADLELTVVDKDGNLVDVYAVSAAVYDPSNVAAGGAVSASWESQGTYIIHWSVPNGLTVGERYLVVITVTVDATGATEQVKFLVQIGGAVL